MKKIILICSLFPALTFASTPQEIATADVYQELCAKEQDPVKRQNYCYMIENNGQARNLLSVFRKDVALA